jgi:metallo-beta-lactamase class B
VNTLKPAIDEEYRTLADRAHTGIMGSSLGGLISFYAGMKYQNTFSKVGVFSPSFWFNDSIYDFAEAMGKVADMKFYFLAGGQESAGLESDLNEMISLLEDEGFEEAELNFQFVANGQHSEWFWAQEFPDAFEWLYLTNPLSSGSLEKIDFEIYPNPSRNFIHFDGVNEPLHFSIFSATGQKVNKGFSPAGKIDVSHLPAGVYFVSGRLNEKVISEKFVKQ